MHEWFQSKDSSSERKTLAANTKSGFIFFFLFVVFACNGNCTFTVTGTGVETGGSVWLGPSQNPSNCENRLLRRMGNISTFLKYPGGFSSGDKLLYSSQSLFTSFSEVRLFAINASSKCSPPGTKNIPFSPLACLVWPQVCNFCQNPT